MWVVILTINSVLLTISGVYLIYAFGTAIITWSGKQFVIALIIFLFFCLAELVINAIVDP